MYEGPKAREKHHGGAERSSTGKSAHDPNMPNNITDSCYTQKTMRNVEIRTVNKVINADTGTAFSI